MFEAARRGNDAAVVSRHQADTAAQAARDVATLLEPLHGLRRVVAVAAEIGGPALRDVEAGTGPAHEPSVPTTSAAVG